MTPIILIHTSQTHPARFDTIASARFGGMILRHIVREDWLKSARKHGIRQRVVDEMAALIHDASGPVICTYTMLGEAAAVLGTIRIDAPMMTEAAKIGGPILLVYALESTAATSLELLEAALAETGQETTVHPLSLAEFWPLFEAGQQEAFTACIAGGVKHAANQTGMRGADTGKYGKCRPDAIRPWRTCPNVP